MRFKEYSGTEQFRPLTAWAYFGYGILFAIPIIGWICLIIFSFSTTNYNRRSYARSFWCVFLVAAIISGITLLTSALFDWPYQEVPVLNRWVPVTSVNLTLTNQDTDVPYGVTPAFRESMAKYEANFDSYIEFMQSYDADQATTEQRTKYGEMKKLYMETMQAFNKFDVTNLSKENSQYYVQVMTRINQKLMALNA